MSKDNKTPKTMGERLRALRKKKGLSQESLSMEIGIARGLISMYEKDQIVPSLTNATYLAQFYKVSIDDILGRKTPSGAFLTEEDLIPFESLGEQLLYLRKTRRLTRSQVSEITGLHANTILAYETDRCIPNVINAECLAIAYQVPVDYIAGIYRVQKETPAENKRVTMRISL